MAGENIVQGAVTDVIIQPTWGTVEGNVDKPKDEGNKLNFADILAQLQIYFDRKADKTHTHDDRYYLKTDVDALLEDLEDTKSDIDHNHDDRYYTETEIDTLLNGKSDSGHTHDYLPLTGGTLTNALTVQTGGVWIQGGSNAGSNNTRMALTSGMPDKFPYNQSKRGVYIYSNAIALADPYNGNTNNDAGWIRHIEETGNSGTLELAVGDDGNESIVARQYNTSSSVVRTLTLLDSSGNTSIPGKLNIHTGFNGYSLALSKENLTVQSTTVVRTGLDICGPTYGNTASELKSNVAGTLSYGDGGPQIRFSSGSAPGQGQNGAIIFTDHDTAGTGVSFNFLSDQGDCYVNAKHFKGTLIGSSSLNVLKTGDTMTGTLIVKSSEGNYREGIRVNRVADTSWADITIGSKADSGTGDFVWFIGTPPTSNGRILYISHNASSSNTYFHADSASRNGPALHLGWSGSVASGNADAVNGGVVYDYIASGNQNRDEHNANNAIKNGVYYYNSNGPAVSLGATTADGGLYVQRYSDIWVVQIAQDYRTGKLFVRGKSNGTWQAWRAVSHHIVSSTALTDGSSALETGMIYYQI